MDHDFLVSRDNQHRFVTGKADFGHPGVVGSLVQGKPEKSQGRADFFTDGSQPDSNAGRKHDFQSPLRTGVSAGPRRVDKL